MVCFDEKNIFGKGVPNDAFAQYFTENSFLCLLIAGQIIYCSYPCHIRSWLEEFSDEYYNSL